VNASSWLLRSGGDRRARVRLFCLPSAGGGGSVYMPWARQLPTVDVCAVQLPGRENRLREPAYTRFAEMMDATFQVLRPHLDMPFALFGHSMGALIAFELARRLRAEGAPVPAHLFVSGHRAPQLPNPRPPLAHLPDAAFLAELRTRYDGVPAEVLRHPDLMALLLPCLRADLALVEDYRCDVAEPLACPISVYGGEDDPVANEAELAAWRAQTRGEFTLTRFAGTHFFIRSAREELLAALSRELALVPETMVGGSGRR
jgi:medium-chain acyl-[acyl-carrier-protein] hydrolase